MNKIILVIKKTIDAGYSALIKIETSPKASKFKGGDRTRITKHKSISSKGNIEKWSKGIFVIDSDLKTGPWTIKSWV